MFFADLHIHSKFSRATGKDADLEHMTLWARKKGVTVLGTGDFTHPQWMRELREKLVPAEPGLFRLRDDLERDVQRQLNESGFSGLGGGCSATIEFRFEINAISPCQSVKSVDEMSVLNHPILPLKETAP